MIPIKYWTHNGVRVYENAGPRHGDRLPLVCVHGMWCAALIFRFWLTLAEIFGYKMYAIELRGHCSDELHQLDGQSVKTHVKDVSAVINDKIGDCILLGQSMGAVIASNVAAENSHVKKLVRVTSASRLGIFQPWLVLKMMLRPNYLWPILVTKKSFRILKNDAIRMLFNAGFNEKEAAAFIEELHPESGKTAFELAFWQVGEKSPLNSGCKILVVGAEHDLITPVSLQLAIAKKHGADYIEIPGTSHAGVLLQPGVRESTFNKIIQWAYGESMPLSKAA